MRLGSCTMSANVTIMQMLSLTACRTRENQVENVGLHGRRPKIVGSGNKHADGVNVIDSELQLRQETLNFSVLHTFLLDNEVHTVGGHGVLFIVYLEPVD